MRKAMMLGVVCLLAAVGCGPSGLRVYKGTSTSTTNVNGGASTTTTTTGAVFSAEPNFDGTGWIFLDGQTSYNATLSSGTSLSFTGGQGITEMSTGANGDTRSLTISTGTGTMTPEQLNLNVTGTVTVGTASAAYTLTFAGQRQ